jgi:hypothetical protein
MARPTLDRNVKFRRLCRTLELPEPYVRGLLETMWDCAHECGNPVLGISVDIEAAAKWPGSAGTFAAAVIDCGLVDEILNGRYRIHDYWDHAPDYVRKRRQREMERERNGAEMETTADNGGQRRTTAPNIITPAPAPAPIEELKSKTHSKSGANESRRPSKRFQPPPVEEVQAYCLERGNGIDAQQFIDHYTSNGWRVGRNPMKDWLAAVRTWERNSGFQKRSPISAAHTGVQTLPKPPTEEMKKRRRAVKGILRYCILVERARSSLPPAAMTLAETYVGELTALSERTDLGGGPMLAEFYRQHDAFTEEMFRSLPDEQCAAIDADRPELVDIAAWRNKSLRETFGLPDPLDVNPGDEATGEVH